MNDLKENLGESEKVLYEPKIHWVAMFDFKLIFFTIVFISLIVFKIIFIDYRTKEVEYAFYFFNIGTIFIFIKNLIYYKTTSFLVTNQRIMKKYGFLSIEIQELSFSKLETINMFQTLIGRITNSGNVYVSGTGSTFLNLIVLDEPLKLKNTISNNIKNN